MKVLLDENIDHRLAGLLDSHEADHVRLIGLAGMVNGALLAEVEALGYGVFLTADKNMRFQQNFAGRGFGMIVLDIHPNKFLTYVQVVPELLAALDEVRAGEIRVIGG